MSMILLLPVVVAVVGIIVLMVAFSAVLDGARNLAAELRSIGRTRIELIETRAGIVGVAQRARTLRRRETPPVV